MTREQYWGPDLLKRAGVYLRSNDGLVELVMSAGDLSIPTGRWSSVVYSEELDGPVMNKDTAVAEFPEYFV